MGDDELRTWLTYAEAGQALEMQPGSAKRLSFRRHWPRRTGNDGLARVGVPMAELGRVTSGDPGGNTGGVSRDATGDSMGTSRNMVPASAETLAMELMHMHVQLAAREGELAGMREALRVAEASTNEATQRANTAEQTALDAWRTTADLARLLTQAKAADVPVQASSPRRRWLERLLR